MKVENWDISKVIPYANNPRKNDDAVTATANSIKEFGWQQPIVVDSEGVVIVGHTRLKAAKKLKLKQVPVTVADNLTEEQAKAYRLADNKTGDLAEWENDLLQQELAGISMDMIPFGFDAEAAAEEAVEDDPYTMKVDVPQYQITGAEPDLGMLIDKTKAEELMADIDEANVPEDIKDFLRIAATRHYKFNYSNIAEYYAHADKDVQKLFEDSALVIIDYNNAIRDGYVKLHGELADMREGESDEKE